MASRDAVHRLVDAIPEARLPVIEQVLRANLDETTLATPRVFASAGTLSAEHDLAERSEDILREDWQGPDA
jgi:alkylated DNA nucleotide flippase Atl1